MKRLNVNEYIVILVFLCCLLYSYNISKQHAANSLHQAYSIIVDRYNSQTDEAIRLATEFDFELRLSNIRNDIHKRQIKDLEAEIDGLRAIINKDKKLKRLLDPIDNNNGPVHNSKTVDVCSHL
jgi:hypothetical protein